MTLWMKRFPDEPPPEPLRQKRPSYREVAALVARSHGLTVSPEKLDDIAARAALAGGDRASIRTMELAFGQLDLAALDASIAEAQREVTRLRSRRRRLATSGQD